MSRNKKQLPHLDEAEVRHQLREADQREIRRLYRERRETRASTNMMVPILGFAAFIVIGVALAMTAMAYRGPEPANPIQFKNGFPVGSAKANQAD